MKKYFTVEVKPTISVAALATGNFAANDVLFDWAEFALPNPAKLVGITARVTGKNGVAQTQKDMDLLFAKSRGGIAPPTLGAENDAVDTHGWFPHIIGMIPLEATNTNSADLIMGNITSATIKSSDNSVVLNPEADGKAYVSSVLSTGTLAFGASTMVLDGASSTSSPLLIVATVNQFVSGIGAGDILRDEDNLLLGTVSHVTSSHIVLKENCANVSTDTKKVYNTTPITLLLAFEI